MPRNLTTATNNALKSEVLRPVTLVRLDFGSGIIALHTGIGDLSFNGDTYLGIGDLGSINQVEENDEITPSGIVLSVTSVPSDYISIALTEDYQGRDCHIYMGLLDESHQLIPDPFLVFKGRMDYMEINLQKENGSISVHVENHLADWNRPRVRRYNHRDQQAEYPTDRGFEYVEQMIEQELIWGRPNASGTKV